MTLEVTGEPAVAADPGEAALDDPALGQDDEAMLFGALDDLEFPGAGLGDERGHVRSLVGAVGEDDLDEWEQTTGSAQQLDGAVAILHVGRMDHDVQEETERIDQDVPLAARDLLARIEPLRIDRGPPFCAPLALWLSITAAEGLASRPAVSRAAT